MHAAHVLTTVELTVPAADTTDAIDTAWSILSSLADELGDTYVEFTENDVTLNDDGTAIVEGEIRVLIQSSVSRPTQSELGTAEAKVQSRLRTPKYSEVFDSEVSGETVVLRNPLGGMDGHHS